MQDNPRSTAIKAVAKANNVDLKVVECDTTQPTFDHLRANGLGKVPAFLGEDGYSLSECIAIAIYSTSTPNSLSSACLALPSPKGFPRHSCMMIKLLFYTVIPV